MKFYILDFFQSSTSGSIKIGTIDLLALKGGSLSIYLFIVGSFPNSKDYLKVTSDEHEVTCWESLFLARRNVDWTSCIIFCNLKVKKENSENFFYEGLNLISDSKSTNS